MPSHENPSLPRAQILPCTRPPKPTPEQLCTRIRHKFNTSNRPHLVLIARTTSPGLYFVPVGQDSVVQVETLSFIRQNNQIIRRVRPLLGGEIVVARPYLHGYATCWIRSSIKAETGSRQSNLLTSALDDPLLCPCSVTVVYLNGSPIRQYPTTDIETFGGRTDGRDAPGASLVVRDCSSWAKCDSIPRRCLGTFIQRLRWGDTGLGWRETGRRGGEGAGTIIDFTSYAEAESAFWCTVDGLDPHTDVEPVLVCDDVIVIIRPIKTSSNCPRSIWIPLIKITVNEPTPPVGEISRCLSSAVCRKGSLVFTVYVEVDWEGTIIDNVITSDGEGKEGESE